MRVAISGASGFVGTRLVAKLLAANHDVIILTRDVAKARAALRNSFSGGTITFVDPSQWAAAIPGCTGVVNLAGEPISTRWSPAIKAEIMASRIKATKRIADAIEACPADLRPAALVNASAVGFYGTSETRVFDESAPAGTDYLSKVCQAWETTAAEIDKAGVRVVLLRLGIVLDRDGGAPEDAPTFQTPRGPIDGAVVQLGAPRGRGGYHHGVADQRGDARTGERAAPNPVRMGEMRAPRTLGRPSWLPVPDFAIQALLGGGDGGASGQKVTPNAAVAAGYKFKYERLDDALQNISGAGGRRADVKNVTRESTLPVRAAGVLHF